jgi:hypothetical protein
MINYRFILTKFYFYSNKLFFLQLGINIYTEMSHFRHSHCKIVYVLIF